MQYQDYILFDTFLSETLDAESVQAFDERLTSDVEFKLAFNDYQQAETFLQRRR